MLVLSLKGVNHVFGCASDLRVHNGGFDLSLKWSYLVAVVLVVDSILHP